MATIDNTYADNTLDIYLNDTWYNTLTADAKAAIVDKNIIQYQYGSNSSSYDPNTHASYADYSTKSVKSEAGDRHIYALDLEDIEEYFNGEFSNSDIRTLFWDETPQFDISTDPWLRSASNNFWNYALYVSGYKGELDFNAGLSVGSARPAFTIDLSKIEWTPANGNSTSNSTSTKTLQCNGKLMASDVVVEVGGVTPTSETWVINEVPSLPYMATYSVGFESNSTRFSEIYMAEHGPESHILYDNSTVADWDNYDGWYDQAYRTITLDSPATGDFLTWLEANAVKQ